MKARMHFGESPFPRDTDKVSNQALKGNREPRMKSRTTQIRASGSIAGALAIAVLTGCSVSPSEIAGACERLDQAKIEQRKATSEFADIVDSGRDVSPSELEQLREENDVVNSSVANRALALQVIIIDEDKADTDFGKNVNQLTKDLLWTASQQKMRIYEHDRDQYLSTELLFRSVLGECKKQGAEIETLTF